MNADFNNYNTARGKRDLPEARDRAFYSVAKQAYEARRSRDAIFGAHEILGEPGWDIMLDLYIAYIEQRLTSVSNACIGSASPSTTGIRWLKVLQQEGLVARKTDPYDSRRGLVQLTPDGIAKMRQYFAKVAVDTDQPAISQPTGH